MFGNKKLKEAIKRLSEEKTALQEEVWELAGQLEEKTVGILIMDVGNHVGETADKILESVKTRMNDEMKRLGMDMDWIVLPSVVKNTQTITVRKEAKE